MPALYNIPYYAPAHTLRANLPSTEEIEAAEEINTKLFEGQYVLIRPLEGENMLYVSHETDVPIPRVYAIYQKRDSAGRTCTYIIMEHIEGQPLNNCWGSLDLATKESIASQLHASFDQLRSLGPPDYFGSLHRRPLYDGLFLTDDEKPRINGPFGSVADLAEALVLKLQHEDEQFPAERTAYYRRVLPRVLRGDGRIRFAHADIQTKNLMLTPNGRVVILDWQSAGWYPSYWEYAVALFCCGLWTDDFHAWMPKFLDEYPNEYLWLANIRTFLWY
ncbi:kinase-like domain-containing protein [Achaetomium macrosporum]|uniref:Kinase-like domain-containing protein n=1 Tax=Achaetomium macrosporum TaxID=79813 RepID=A0AAN7C3R2_9PEZI|nr:kinase-like domain-containing protein [Achaetomium macrosporum]